MPVHDAICYTVWDIPLATLGQLFLFSSLPAPPVPQTPLLIILKAFAFPFHSLPKIPPALSEGLLHPITDHVSLLIPCTQFSSHTGEMQIEASQGIRLNISSDFQVTFH